MANERPTVMVPAICDKHKTLLLQQLGIGREGPWQSTIVAAQITLFQGAAAHPSTHERIGDDITRITELGCLACDRPEVFGEAVNAWKQGGLGAVKALGDRYCGIDLQQGSR